MSEQEKQDFIVIAWDDDDESYEILKQDMPLEQRFVDYFSTISSCQQKFIIYEFDPCDSQTQGLRIVHRRIGGIRVDVVYNEGNLEVGDYELVDGNWKQLNELAFFRKRLEKIKATIYKEDLSPQEIVECLNQEIDYLAEKEKNGSK